MASPADEAFLPLPVVDASTLTYERFLREFALPKQPCLLTNVGSSWAAKAWDVNYLLAHDLVDESHKVHVAHGRPGGAREVATSVGKALRGVAAVAAAADADVSAPCYLSAWDYVRGNSGALQEDFTVPRFFERAPAWLSSHVVLGNAATDMKWLYIGTFGSGSATHVDTNLSSAWLWVAAGRKEWVCAHGGDHALLTQGTGSAAYGYAANAANSDEEDASGSSDGESATSTLPDFFADDLYERWPHARGARLYRGFQSAGEVCFNPSMCVHAVRNVGSPSEIVISLTHNFVDASNFAEVLSDATRSIIEELLPMARALKPRTVLKTLAKSLRMPREALSRTLAELPDLAADERIEELIACAAAGAAADEAEPATRDVEASRDGEAVAGHGPEEAVAALLRRTLQERLCEVRPAFVRAATALRDALKLDPPDQQHPQPDVT